MKYSIKLLFIVALLSFFTLPSYAQIPNLDLGNDTTLCDGESISWDLSDAQALCPTCSFTWSSCCFCTDLIHEIKAIDICYPVPDAGIRPWTIQEILFINNGSFFYSDTINITFAGEVVADAGPSVKHCWGDTVSVGGSPSASGGTETGYIYSWTKVGDTTILDTLPNPGVSFITNTFLRLEVQDSIQPRCMDTSVVFVESISPPLVNLNFTDLNCANDTFLLHTSIITDTTGVSYWWSNGQWGDTVAYWIEDSTQLQTNVYAPGVEQITFDFYVEDSLGCGYTYPINVNLSALPIANFSYDTACFGEVISFTNHSTTVSNTDSIIWNVWDFDNLSFGSSIENPIIPTIAGPTSDSLYQVTLSVLSSIGCANDTTIDVLVRGNPVANTTFDSATYCPNVPVPLGVTASGGAGPYAYYWTQEGVLIDSAFQNPIVFPNQDGLNHSYVVTVMDMNGCVGIDSSIVNLVDLKAHASTYDGLIYVCEFDSALLGGFPEVASGGTIPYFYTWSTESLGTPIDNDTIPHPQVLVSDSQYFYLRVEDNGGCFDFDTVLVRSLRNPVLGLLDTAVCEGEPVLLARNLQERDDLSYSWTPNVFDNPDDSLNVSNLHWSVKPSLNTSYILSAQYIIPNSPPCTSMDTVDIQVYPRPLLDAGEDTSLCHFDSLMLNAFSNASIVWEDGYQNGDYVKVLNNTYFYVTATDSMGCVSNDSLFVFASDCIEDGIDELNTPLSIELFPNPSNGIVYVDVKSETSVLVDLEIYDQTGRLVKQLTDVASIQILELEPGTYQVKMISGQSVGISRLVVH